MGHLAAGCLGHEAQVTPVHAPDNPAEDVLTEALPTLLLTRQAADSARVARAWRARHGAEAAVVVSPVTEIVAVPFRGELSRYRALVFTSPNAVPRVQGAGRPSRAWCVGERTAEAASAAGFDARAAGGSSDDLVAAIVRSGEPGPMLHLRGRESRGSVAARLSAAGTDCDEAIVYEQSARPLSEEAVRLLAGPAPLLIPLFSPNSARRLAAAMADVAVKAPLRIAPMSPAVARAWNGPAPTHVLVAEAPDMAAMLEALSELALAR